MSLFKVCRGAEGNLPATLTDGYAYFCTDTGSFYIDHKNTSNTLVRSKISAKYADKLRYVKNGQTVEIDASAVLTASNAVTTIGTATASKAGFMSTADKTKLDGVAAGAEKNIVYVGPTAPTDPNIKVWINTSEEGAGVIPVLPRITTVTLTASKWTGSASPYSQVVTVNSVTTNSKVDLQPTAAQIVDLQNADIALMAENNGGTVTFYSFGGKPSSNMAMQVLLTEVAYV